MRAAPFARFRAMMALVAAAMGAGLSHATALEQAGAYKSRGKGKNRNQVSARFVAHDKRAAVKAKNRQRHRRACK